MATIRILTESAQDEQFMFMLNQYFDSVTVVDDLGDGRTEYFVTGRGVPSDNTEVLLCIADTKPSAGSTSNIPVSARLHSSVVYAYWESLK